MNAKMSDLKRVPLTTIEPKKSATTSAKASKTVRLELKLFEPNATKNPEFSYTKLLEIEKVRAKRLVWNGGKEKNYFFVFFNFRTFHSGPKCVFMCVRCAFVCMRRAMVELNGVWLRQSKYLCNWTRAFSTRIRH